MKKLLALAGAILTTSAIAAPSQIHCPTSVISKSQIQQSAGIIDNWSVLTKATQFNYQKYYLWMAVINANKSGDLPACVYSPNPQNPSVSSKQNVVLVDFQLGGGYALAKPGNGKWYLQGSNYQCNELGNIQTCGFSIVTPTHI